MIKTVIVSGFLGSGKTTLIRKLLREAFAGRKAAIIENDFGEVNVDGTLLKDTKLEIRELNAGCICCTLAADFKGAIGDIIENYAPELLIIEPSGVAKLSDIIGAVKAAAPDRLSIEYMGTTVDASRFELFRETFGEFFEDQIQHTGGVLLSHTAGLSDSEIDGLFHEIRELNASCSIVSTDWDQLESEAVLKAMALAQGSDSHLDVLNILGCGNEEHGHGYHHEKTENHHHHHHDQGEGCCHDHSHSDHHHADEIFDELGFETPRHYRPERIEEIFADLEGDPSCGRIIRGKGILPAPDGTWFHFDYLPGTIRIEPASPQTRGMIALVGTDFNRELIEEKLSF